MTVAAMTAKILGELDRDDLTQEVSTAIVAAVSWYAHERFFFNEGQHVFTTATASEAYEIATVLEIDSAAITVNGHPYRLTPRTFQYIDANRDPAYVGYPDDFAVFNDRIYLHPIPNKTLTVVVSGCIAPATLSSTADTNVFLQHAEELIRCHAKADIYANLLGEGDMAQAMAEREAAVLARLQQRSDSKVRAGFVTPTEF